MTTATTIKENCDDVLADAKEINEQRAEAEAELVEDTAAEVADEAEETVEAAAE